MFVVAQRDTDTPYGMSFFTGGVRLVRYEDGEITMQLDMSSEPEDAFQFYGYREPSDIIRRFGIDDDYDVVDLNEVR